MAESEGFSDALLIGSVLVAATHRPDSIAQAAFRQQAAEKRREPYSRELFVRMRKNVGQG